MKKWCTCPLRPLCPPVSTSLIGVLEEEAGVALNWLKQNQMIAYPEKFLATLIRKDQSNLSWKYLNIKGKPIKMEETVKLLGICLDYKLNFQSTYLKFVEICIAT